MLQEGSYDGHERESLEFSKDADMNILSPIFWDRCKLSRSTRPDHICHWAVQCERSNRATFKNFHDILAVFKHHWPYVMEILEGGESLFRNYMYLFFFFKKNTPYVTKSDILLGCRKARNSVQELNQNL